MHTISDARKRRPHSDQGVGASPIYDQLQAEARVHGYDWNSDESLYRDEPLFELDEVIENPMIQAED